MRVTDSIIEAVKRASGQDGVKLETPAQSEHGDYSTNVAMVAGLDPQELLVKLQEDKDLLRYVARIEVAGPGFINFWLSEEFLNEQMNQESYSTDFLAGKKISVEFTDPNPFKEFHIGHLYSNIVGESVCRILEANGATVWRADYFGDVGMHVAKSIWGIRKKLESDGKSFEDLEDLDLKERIEFFGEGYAMGATAFEQEGEEAEEIKRMNKILFMVAQKMWKNEGFEIKVDYDPDNEVSSKEIDELYEIYVKGREWSLEYFEQIYKRLGTKFDGYYPESKAGEFGYGLVKSNVGRVFKESEGAIVFDGSSDGLHTRVFINKLGLPTYEAKELGLAPLKKKDFDYDKSLIVTGNEISEYFKVLIAAMKKVEPELGNVTEHLGHGMVRLPEGKMSSRTGKILRGEWLLDEARDKAVKLIEEKQSATESKDSLAEQIGQAAIKYALLKISVGGDVSFDFDESVSFEGNSGPYLQYTFARTASVLAKITPPSLKLRKGKQAIEENERDLLRHLVKYEEALVEAANQYAPNVICLYLYELAQKFNAFYNAEKIIGSDSEGFRARLTRKTGETLKHGLAILGIQAPDHM